MAFFWQKKEKKERDWNLDFLTPMEKSAINMAFEMAEKMSANDSETTKFAIQKAKNHYLADMGYIDSDEGYTKEDIAIIVTWVGFTEKMLTETKLPGMEEQTKLLTQVKASLVESGLVDDLAGVEVTKKGTESSRKDLSYLLPAEKNVVRIALDSVINTRYYDGEQLIKCHNAKAHLLADCDYSADDFRYMGFSLEVLISTIKGLMRTAEGEKLQNYQTNLNLATSALKKIRQ